MFITLEGIEGSGKSTQAARLVARLRTEGRAARQTREPGGTPLADAVRALLLHPEAAADALRAAQITSVLSAEDDAGDAPEPVLPMTEVFLLSAARAQHVARLRTWLAAGQIVVCDRFADATRAYQGFARGLDLDDIGTMEHLATGGLTPDITLLLDLPPAEGLRRKRLALTRAEHQLRLFDGGTSADNANGQDTRNDAIATEWNRLDQEALPFHERVRAGYLRLAATEPERWVVLDATLPPDALADRVWAAVGPRLTPA